jgi:hypothetical protein
MTPQSISAYLDALKAALKGAPPGLVADALADAEEHLREAMGAHPGLSEAEAFAQMAGRYGTPEEVAAEYLAIELPPPSPFAKAPAAPAARSRPYPGFFGVLKDPVTYGALLYMLLALATGIFYFTWAVTGLSLSLGFLILIIGIPFFLLFVGSIRILGHVEGRIVETLLGVRMPRRLPAAPDGSFWDKVKDALSDVRTWSSLIYMLGMLPLGIAYFTIAVTGLAVAGAGVFGGAAQLVGFHEVGNHEIFQVDGAPAWLVHGIHSPLAGAVFIALGVLIFFLMLHVARLIGWLHGRIAEHLLVRL